MKFIGVLILLCLPLLVGFSYHHIAVSYENLTSGWLISNSYFPDHLAGAFTGGFNEPNCQSCHFDYDLNKSEGKLTISGIDSVVVPSTDYLITIKVTRPDLGKAGFQMTSRYPDGTQAGQFQVNEFVTFTPNTPDTSAYLQHAVGNVEPNKMVKTWSFIWTSPNTFISETIIFNIAANAANGDASEFGDWIYVREIVVKAAR